MATPSEETLRSTVAELAKVTGLNLWLRACPAGKFCLAQTIPFPPPMRGSQLDDLSPPLTRRDLLHWLMGFADGLSAAAGEHNGHQD